MVGRIYWFSTVHGKSLRELLSSECDACHALLQSKSLYEGIPPIDGDCQRQAQETPRGAVSARQGSVAQASSGRNNSDGLWRCSAELDFLLRLNSQVVSACLMNAGEPRLTTLLLRRHALKVALPASAEIRPFAPESS